MASISLIKYAKRRREIPDELVTAAKAMGLIAAFLTFDFAVAISVNYVFAGFKVHTRDEITTGIVVAALLMFFGALGLIAHWRERHED